MKRLLRPENLLLALIGLLLLALASGLGFYVYQRYAEVQTQVEQLEPRYARLLGLKASGAELEQVLAANQATLTLYAYPASPEKDKDKSQTGNDAQQRLREVFTKAGLEVISSQALPPKPGKQFDKIPLSIKLEGNINQLQAALVVLASQSPVVLVDAFAVQTIGLVRADTAQRLAVQLELAVLKVATP